MNAVKIKFFAVCNLGVVFALLQASPAAAECRPFPKLEFWGDMSHASVTDYVKTKHDGDWDVYIKKLEKINKGLTKIHKRGKGAVIKLKGRRVSLRGRKLSNYIKLSGKRMKIIRCLADKAEFAELQNFSTAAGGDAKVNSPDVSPPVEKSDVFRTYLSLPQSLAEELRKQAARRSLAENRKVSVNDLIVRTLRQKYAK